MTVRIKRHQPAWLLIAFAFAFAGCGGKDAVTPVDIEKQAWEDLRSDVREVISDPEREAEAIKLVDALAEDLNAFREVLTKRHERVRELNTNYDTTRAEFDAFLKQVSTEIQASQQRVSGKHQAFLAVTTPDEWSQLSKARSKAMTAAVKSMQAI
jgi:arginyl-tRNA--protein-N-Asp/Glu arginylyltransferase